MNSHRRLLLVTLLTALVFLLAACAAAPATPATTDTGSETTSEEPATEEEAAPAEETAEEPAEETAEEPAETSSTVDTSGLTILGYSDEQVPVWVRNFNPFAPDPLNTAAYMVYEPMIIFNIAKNGEPTPWLATEYAYSDDLASVTFTLREGVKWSDGEDFTAEDVVFTFTMLRDSPSLDKPAVWEILEDVTMDDDYTVTFTLNKVYTLAHERIGGVNIVPEHVWAEVADPVTFTNENPVGTGPFTEILDFQDQVYLQCKNPNYWQEGKPHFDCLRLTANPGNEQAIAGMIAGEIDWAGHFVPDIEKTYIAADPEHNNYYFTPNDTISLYMNTTQAPFDDLAFRQALSRALDREEIVAIASYGYATVNDNAGGLTGIYRDWYNTDALTDAGTLGTFAADDAAAMLDEAGYVDADGDGWRDMPDGSPLSFKIQVVNGWTDWVTSVQMASEYFQDIGINAEVDTPDFGAWFSNLQAGTYGMSIGWGSVNPTPWNYYHDALHSAMIIEDQAQGISWSRWSSPETDKLIDDFVATTDRAEQEAIIDALQLAVIENVPFIPLFSNPGWYEYSTRNFTGFPNEENYYARGMPFEGVAERLIVVTTIEPVK